MSRRMVVGVVVALWLFAVACGSGSPAANTNPAPGGASTGGATVAAPAAPAATGPGKINDRIEVSGIALTVTKVEQKAELGQFNKAKDGNIFVVAEVLIENVNSDKAPYNPLYFSVKDGDGFESNAELVAGDQALQSGDLAKGDKARGNVAFEVKKGATGLVLQYKPLVFGRSEAIRVALN